MASKGVENNESVPLESLTSGEQDYFIYLSGFSKAL